MGVPKEVGRMVRLVLVGGGHAHEQVVKALSRQSLEASMDGRKFEMVLISDSVSAMYSGMVPGVVAGEYSELDASVRLDTLCARHGWKFVRGRVTGLSAARKEVVVDGESVIGYDLLSLDVGSSTRKIAGVGDALRAGANILMTRPIATLNQRFTDIERRLEGEDLIRVVVVGGGAAGTELAFAAVDRFGSRAKVTVLTADPSKLGSFQQRRAANAVASEMRTNNIGLVEARVDRVTTDSVLLSDGSTRAYDVLVIAAGAEGHAWLRETDLQLDERGFIRVSNTLQAARYPSVMAAGDCASLPTPVPKAGVYAVRMGPVLSKNLRAYLVALARGDRVQTLGLKEFRAQKSILSLIKTNDGMAMGSKWGLVFRGRWVRRLKDSIDRGWMARFDGSEAAPPPAQGQFSGGPAEAAAVLLGSDVLEENFERQVSVLERMASDDDFRSEVLTVVDNDEQ